MFPFQNELIIPLLALFTNAVQIGTYNYIPVAFFAAVVPSAGEPGCPALLGEVIAVGIAAIAREIAFIHGFLKAAGNVIKFTV